MRYAVTSTSMIACLVVLMAGLTCVAQPTLPAGDPDPILTPVTREWQAEALVRLKELRPEVTTTILETEGQGEGLVIVSYGLEGILWLGREDWVYMNAFSSHTPDPQVVLVIDRKGRVYRTFEHVCPTLALHVPEGAGFGSAEAFLRTTVGYGDQAYGWELLDDNAATAERERLPTACEHQLQVAASPEAAPGARGLAVCALIREGSAESWDIVEQALADAAVRAVLEEKGPLIAQALIRDGGDRGWALAERILTGSTDWALLDEARRLAAERDPAHAAVIERILDESLGTEPLERGRHLAEAILAAGSRETIGYLLSRVRNADPDVVCAAFEDVARVQQQRTFWQIAGFDALRNSIAAYMELDRERAAEFYRSLLASEDRSQREAGIYGVSEMRLPDTVEDLMTLVDRDAENSFHPSAVCVALGKIGTADAHDALIELLLQEPIHVKQSWSVLVVMSDVCGCTGHKSPAGAWSNGCWATVADDTAATGRLFAGAMEQLAERTTDERLAREARGRAASITRQ